MSEAEKTRHSPESVELHNLMFDIESSFRYHSRRAGFFERFGEQVSAFGVIIGAAAVGSLIGQLATWIPATLTAAFTILEATKLAFGTDRRSKLHAELAKRFQLLKLEILRSEDTSMKAIRAFQARYLEIEVEEPPTLRILNAICHNEVNKSMGYGSSDDLRIGYLQRKFAQFFDLGDFGPPSRAS